MTEAFAQYGDVTDGYSVCLLLLIIKDVDVELNGNSTYLSKVWLEDSDGVSATPMNSALAYGEYAAAPGGAFTVSTGQAIRIAIPYQLPDGETSYTVMVDGTEVPVELVEGSRSIG